MEKLFNSYKGVALFYLVVFILSFIYVIRINSLNRIEKSNINDNHVYCAYLNE